MLCGPHGLCTNERLKIQIFVNHITAWLNLNWNYVINTRFQSRVIRSGGRSGTGAGLSRVLRFSAVNHHSPLLQTHLSPPHVVCRSPDQAAYDVTLWPLTTLSLA